MITPGVMVLTVTCFNNIEQWGETMMVRFKHAVCRRAVFNVVFVLSLLLVACPVLAQGDSGTPLLGPLNSDPLT